MKTHPIEVIMQGAFDKISALCGEYFYRYQRYEANFSMALFYLNEALDLEVFTQSIRESDKLIPLQNNLICIVFDMTSGEKGLKASENILAKYEVKHFNQKLFISYVDMEDFNNKEAMKTQLFSLLHFAIKENNYNQITDRFYELEPL